MMASHCSMSTNNFRLQAFAGLCLIVMLQCVVQFIRRLIDTHRTGKSW